MSDIIIYSTADGKAKINLYANDGTVWLSANQIAILFDKDEKTIRKHINNIFADEELPRVNNTQKMRVVGVKQHVTFYSLDVILAVGFRVRSPRGTQFRQWANSTLKEYLQKGFILDKDRQNLNLLNHFCKICHFWKRRLCLSQKLPFLEKTALSLSKILCSVKF